MFVVSNGEDGWKKRIIMICIKYRYCNLSFATFYIVMWAGVYNIVISFRTHNYVFNCSLTSATVARPGRGIFQEARAASTRLT